MQPFLRLTAAMSPIFTRAERTTILDKIRQVVPQSFEHAKVTCASPWVLDYGTTLPGTTITFHVLLKILSVVPVISSTLICMYLITGHLLHWTRPREQRQILRVILFIPIYSIIAFFSVWFYHVSAFLAPYGQWIEGFALSALFLLYLEIANPGCVHQEYFYSKLERKLVTGKSKGDKGSLRWFRVLNMMVFQLFFTRIATVIGQDIFLGLTCPMSPSRSTGLTVIQVVNGFSTAVAIWGLVFLERRMHSEMQKHLATGKLWSFKAVAGLDMIQVIVFPSLAEHQVFQPSPPFYVSWNDFALALPSFILVWEMLIVAIVFLWSFSFSRYRHHVLHDNEQPVKDVGGALWDVFNISDIWEGVAYAFWHRIPSSWRRADEVAMQPLHGRSIHDSGKPLESA